MGCTDNPEVNFVSIASCVTATFQRLPLCFSTFFIRTSGWIFLSLSLSLLYIKRILFSITLIIKMQKNPSTIKVLGFAIAKY